MTLESTSALELAPGVREFACRVRQRGAHPHDFGETVVAHPRPQGRGSRSGGGLTLNLGIGDGTQNITAPPQFKSLSPNHDPLDDAIGLRACGFYGILTGR
ncbi:hypothetical protein ACIBEH_05405 [Nocardia salmonicida]|uniref:hypothetical protein n=1 Tax=Nocardia salmonicida TaxID=53431 RepID=UPI0037B98218